MRKNNNLMRKNNYIGKFHRRTTHALSISVLGFACFLLIIIFVPRIGDAIIQLIVICLIPPVYIYIYIYIYGWNSTMYFNEEEVWTRIRYKRYKWLWDNVEECVDYCLATRHGGIYFIKIKFKDSKKKLKFEMDAFSRYKNRNIKQLLAVVPDGIFKDFLQEKLKEREKKPKKNTEEQIK